MILFTDSPGGSLQKLQMQRNTYLVQKKVFQIIFLTSEDAFYDKGLFLGLFPSAHKDIRLLFVPRLSLVNVIK